MYRCCVASVVLASLCGCASHGPVPEAAAVSSAPSIAAAAPTIVAAQTTPPALDANSDTPTGAPAAATPATTVDIKDFEGQTICESITLPGSRMVVEKHCYTPSKNDRLAAQRAELTRLQVENLRRQQQDMERMQRDRDRETLSRGGSRPR